MFSDILLTVDYDRTLTAPDSTIPQRNLDAIRYFMEEGGIFTLATGRSLPTGEGDIPVGCALALSPRAEAVLKDGKFPPYLNILFN